MYSGLVANRDGPIYRKSRVLSWRCQGLNQDLRFAKHMRYTTTELHPLISMIHIPEQTQTWKFQEMATLKLVLNFISFCTEEVSVPEGPPCKHNLSRTPINAKQKGNKFTVSSSFFLSCQEAVYSTLQIKALIEK